MFRLLFPEQIESFYRRSLDAMRREDRGLAISLFLERGSPELTTIRWELAFDKREDVFLALQRRVTMVRAVEASAPVALVPTARPRALVVVANPEGLPPVDIAEERNGIDKALGAFAWDFLAEPGFPPGKSTTRSEGGNILDIEDRLRDGHDILHFIGHGRLKGPQAWMVLEGELGGAQDVAPKRLVDILPAGQIKLLVLAAAGSANAETGEAFKLMAQELVGFGLPAVLVIPSTGQSQAGHREAFSQIFYEALAGGLPVERAVSEARTRVSLVERDNFYWGLPVLYTRAGPGVYWIPSGDDSDSIETTIEGVS